MVCCAQEKRPTYIQEDRLNMFLQGGADNYRDQIKIDTKPVLQPWHLKVAQR